MEFCFSTDRFTLKKIDDSVVNEDYLSWFNGLKKSENETAKSYNSLDDLRAYINSKKKSNILFMAIFLKSENIHIGNIKFEPLNFELNETYLGILIGNPDWRGKGVAKEVIISSARFLKEKYGINKIKLGVYKENQSAFKAYLKVGFEVDDSGINNFNDPNVIGMVYKIN